MDLRLNDIVEMKKPHPCGEKLWLVTRVGMDIKLKCTRCAIGHGVHGFAMNLLRVVSVCNRALLS